MKKKLGRPSKIEVGDYLRVNQGPLEGAEGLVVGEKVVGPPRRQITLIEIRQLNGNPIRLPRHQFEFAALRASRELDG